MSARRKENIMTIEPDPVRSLITSRAKQFGYSWAFLSKKCGRNPAYFHQYIHKNTPRRLPERLRFVVAKLLDIEETRLRGEFHMEGIERTVPEVDGYDAVIARQIPTWGHPTGGRLGEFKLHEDNKTGDVPAPPILANVRDAYAIYMVGNLMEPRYFPGELVYAHPGLPVRNRDFVVLKIVDGDAGNVKENRAPLVLVRQQIERTTETTTFAQLNPYEAMTLTADQIISVHRIVLAGGT